MWILLFGGTKLQNKSSRFEDLKTQYLFQDCRQHARWFFQ